MRPGEVLLRYQHLEERVRTLEDERAHVADRLANNPESAALEVELAEAKSAHEHALKRLEAMDREVSAHRSRMRTHEKELMSGRVRSPSDLTKMSTEVEHMKAALVQEEDAELEVMAGVEETQQQVAALEKRLADSGARHEAATPGLEKRLAAIDGELGGLRSELESLWSQVPGDYQVAYRRLARVSSPVAEVARGECGGCHVGLTPSELQQVRRGDQLLTCQSCSRILVAV